MFPQDLKGNEITLGERERERERERMKKEEKDQEKRQTHEVTFVINKKYTSFSSSLYLLSFLPRFVHT